MISDPSTTILYVVIGVVAFLALATPAYTLIAADLFLVVLLRDGWEVANVMMDATDVVVAGIMIALAFGSKTKKRAFRDIPYRDLWIGFGVLASLAYVFTPQNQQYLTNPVRVVYQLYRYAWRPILFYPLCAMLIVDRKAIVRMLTLVVGAALFAAALALPQGYAGNEAVGPFNHHNTLGGSLIIPMVLAVSGIVAPWGRRGRAFCIVSLVVMFRALVFSGSRGALIATAGGGAFVLGSFLSTPTGQRRVMTAVGIGLAILAGVLVVKPDLLERPTIQRFVEVASPGEVDTFAWRRELRWPHFTQFALESPLLGRGNDVDLDLGDEGNTPHNGYLSVAVINGIPAAILVVALALLGVRSGARVYRADHGGAIGMLGLAMAASIVGVLIHDLVDATLQMAFAARLFWMAVAVAGMLQRSPEDFDVQPAGTPVRASDGAVGDGASLVGAAA